MFKTLGFLGIPGFSSALNEIFQKNNYESLNKTSRNTSEAIKEVNLVLGLKIT